MCDIFNLYTPEGIDSTCTCFNGPSGVPYSIFEREYINNHKHSC